MKKKQGRTLLMLVAALAALIVGYVVIKTVADNKISEQAAADAAANAITSISDANELWFDNGELELSFVKADGAWVCEQHESYPIKSTAIENLVYSAGSLSAERILENHGALAEYGLDAPEMSVRVGSDSQQATLLISRGADGTYYLLKEGDERVFTIGDALPSALETDILALIDYEDIPTVYSDQITGLTLNRDGVVYAYTRSLSGEDEDGKPVYSWSCLKDGAAAEILDSNVSTAAYDVENLRFTECVAYFEDSAGLEAFGFGGTSLEVFYEADDGQQLSFTLRFGDATGDAGESRFMGINDSLAVTIASAEIADELASLLASA